LFGLRRGRRVIIRAEALGLFIEGKRAKLPCAGGALEFVAEVLKVCLTDVQMEDFLDHRREVRQRPNRPEWWRMGRPRRTPRRRKGQRILDGFQRHAPFLQFSCKQTIRPADHARCSRRRTIRFESPPDILALFHDDEPQPCGSRSDGPLMVTV
jgi:hypothetical protein